jgi:hypothetical protein
VWLLVICGGTLVGAQATSPEATASTLDVVRLKK